MDLDDLPLELLLALQDAMTDPSEAGQARAQLRAADAGFFLVRGETVEVRRGGLRGAGAAPQTDPSPVEAPEAPEGIEAEVLRFEEE